MVKPRREDLIWIEMAECKDTDKVELFTIDWPSYWHDEVIEISVTATKRPNGRWLILSMGLPMGASPDDIEEIENTKWYIVPFTTERKLPPIKLAWGFDNPEVFILACEHAPASSYRPLEDQLKDLLMEHSIDPARYSVINAIRRLGPGRCTVISSIGVLEFSITDDGEFSDPIYPTNILRAPKKHSSPSMNIAAYLGALIMLLPTAIIVKSLTGERTCVKSGASSITPVEVKKIYCFKTDLVLSEDGEQRLYWHKVTPQQAREICEFELALSGNSRPSIYEREYRFA